MVTKFEKSMYQNLLIIDDISADVSKFQEEMLLNNTIEGFLSFSIRYVDQEKKYAYAVTGMQCMQSVYEKLCPNQEEFRNLFEQILRYIKILNTYLLEAEDIVLDPQFIFMQTEPMQVQLCCCPGYGKDIMGQLAKLLEYFMNHIEYSDKDAVVLVYAVYMNSRDENTTIDRLYQVLMQEDPHTASEQKGVSVPIDTGKEQAKITKPAGMREKYSREVEVLYYPIKSYMICMLSFLASFLFFLVLFQSGFLHEALGHRLNREKTIFVFLFFLLVHAATLYVAFHKDRKHSRMEDEPVYWHPDAADSFKEGKGTSRLADAAYADPYKLPLDAEP